MQMKNESDFLWVFGAYAVIQVLDGNVLVPLLFSAAVNLHPVALVSAVLVFGGRWGLWGVGGAGGRVSVHSCAISLVESARSHAHDAAILPGP